MPIGRSRKRFSGRPKIEIEKLRDVVNDQHAATIAALDACLVLAQRVTDLQADVSKILDLDGTIH